MSDDSSDSDFDEDPDEIGVPGGGKDLATVMSITSSNKNEPPKPSNVVPQGVSGLKQQPLTVRYNQHRPPVPNLPNFGTRFANHSNNLVGMPQVVNRPAQVGLSGKEVSNMWMNADTKQMPVINPQAIITEEDEDDEEMGVAETYATYRPAKLKLGRPHPDTVVETASLSSVEPADVWYNLSIPNDTIRSGALSALQLESITYASQQHAHLLPDGSRAGFFIGDGAGVGKGRTIAGIIFENYCKGRKKAIWVSVSNDLKYDAERDLMDIGASQVKVYALNKFKYGKLSSSTNGNVKKGVIFSTYSALIGETGLTSLGTKYTSRLKQLVQWCGEDFDGLIVFDECHRAKNLCPSVSSKPSKTGLTVLELQNKLPKARVVYASATGASEPKNMAYMVRLGMWGKGSPFSTFNDFIVAVERRGVGAMEIVAMDMKLRGMYIARQLGFQGVTFKIEEVPLSEDFKKTYDQAVKLWVEAMQKFHEASNLIQAESRMKKTMWSQFWSSHQRFFKYLCIAAKVKHTISLAREALKCGKCVVIGLQSTGEARTLEQLEREDGELNDFVSTAKGVFQSLVEKHFPAPNRNNINRVLGLNLPLSNSDSWMNPSKRKIVQPPIQPAPKKIRILDLSDDESVEPENGKSDSNSVVKQIDSESEDDAQSDEENSDVNSDYNPFDSDSDSDVDPWDRRKKKEGKKTLKKKSKKSKANNTSTQDTIQAMLMKKSAPSTTMISTALKTTTATTTVQPTAMKTINMGVGRKSNGVASSSSSVSTLAPSPMISSNETRDQNASANSIDRACNMKEELLAKIETLGVVLPPNTLDQLIDELGGTENVAEMTGRKGRVVQTDDGSVKYETRSEIDVPLETLNLTEKQRFMNGEKTVAIISEAASSGISLQSDRRARNQMRRVHITLELPWSADRAIQQFGRTHRSNQVNAPEYVFLISNLAGERRFASTVSKRLESLGALTHGDRRATETRDLSQFNIDNKYGRAALETTMRAIMGFEKPLVPPPQDYRGNFFKDIAVALVGVGLIYNENGSYSLDKDYNNITKFLNRILGVPVELQNYLFQYFTDTLNAIITHAKRSGRFDMGILDLGASGESVRRVKLIRFLRKHATGIAPTELHIVHVERGMNWEDAESRWTQTEDVFEGFYLSHHVRNGKRSVLLAVCGSELKKTESKRDQLYILYRPNTGLQLRQETLTELEKKYKKVREEEARAHWISQYQASLTTCSHAYWRGNCKNATVGLECETGLRRRSYNVLSGSVLSVWSQVETILASRLGNNSKMQVVRLRTEDDIKIVGTLIPKSCMDALRHVLQTNAEKVEEQNF
ncbi:protein strawberry notch-like [Copidosoma floridanum]|uniref:protein strawberry notch-like n=1 Tax=Copidosoma floridanum TaxID=29053 RepID=UPI0006C9810E|nr:protein strawberry notch-like [Copidosoma floridanum]